MLVWSIILAQLVMTIALPFANCYFIGWIEIPFLVLSLFGPLSCGLIPIAANRSKKKLADFVPILIGIVATLLIFAGTRIVSNQLRRIAEDRGDVILTCMEKYRTDHGRSIENLAALVPDYLAEIPNPPYFDSEYFTRDGNKVQFNAGAMIICEKSIGGEWVCDD